MEGDHPLNLLAFDASGRRAGVSIWSGGRLLFSRESARADGRKEELHAELAAAMKETRLKFSNLDGVVVGLGPGSFTGLRIAVTTAKTLAWSGKVQFFGYSTLEAIAAASSNKQDRVVMEAGRGNVYTASYAGSPGKTWRVVRKPQISKKTVKLSLTLVLPANQISDALIELALHNPKQGKMNPLKAEPLYLYPRDCNVTIA